MSVLSYCLAAQRVRPHIKPAQQDPGLKTPAVRESVRLTGRRFEEQCWRRNKDASELAVVHRSNKHSGAE